MLGRNWMLHIQLDWGSITDSRERRESYWVEFDEVFRDGLGTLRPITIHF